jgi:hypothetical protein
LQNALRQTVFKQAKIQKRHQGRNCPQNKRGNEEKENNMIEASVLFGVCLVLGVVYLLLLPPLSNLYEKYSDWWEEKL